MDPIEIKIIGIISEKVGIPGNAISEDADLTIDLGLDSLDTVELILDIEKAFNLTIPDEEVQNIRTVRQAIEAVMVELKRKEI